MKRLFTLFMAFALSASLFTGSASYATATGTVIYQAPEVASCVTEGFYTAGKQTLLQGAEAIKNSLYFVKDFGSLWLKYPAHTVFFASAPLVAHKWYRYLTQDNKHKEALPFWETILAVTCGYIALEASYNPFNKIK